MLQTDAEFIIKYPNTKFYMLTNKSEIHFGAICLEAVKQTYWSLQYVQNQTERKHLNKTGLY